MAYNKIAEYHTELELIPIEEHSNVYISVPVSLEQHFVEGSYSQIQLQKQKIPMQSYQIFIDKFSDAIRFETARSAERAYESLRIADMGPMFVLNSQAEV